MRRRGAHHGVTMVPRVAGAAVGAVLTLIAALVIGPAAPAGAFSLHLTRMAVTPTSGLVSNQAVSVNISHGSPGTTYVVAVCDPGAYALLLQAASVQDGCDARHTAVVTVDAGGAAAATLAIPAVLTTAAGPADCRSRRCFLAAAALHSTGGIGLLIKHLSFTSDACSVPGSCSVPADAWDPSLGPAPVDGVTPAPGSSAVPRDRTASAVGAAGAVGRASVPEGMGSAGHPVTRPLAPVPAGPLSAAGSVTGPYATALPQPASGGEGRPAVTGEGLLRLALASPGTSWGPGPPRSSVVDATVSDLTTGRTLGTQQFVLFWGASPFVYAGFTGPVTTTDRYRVAVDVEPAAAAKGLSRPASGIPPEVAVLDQTLEVVSPSDPEYLAYSYAPVMYGRSTSALHDVPLLGYADATSASGGATTLSYVFVWSHEDGGTGFVPFLLWGGWGRTTDIETSISFTVRPDGSVTEARYLSGGEPSTGYPDSRSALQEEERTFAGTWSGHHPVLRVATGNNDVSDQGTTRFRFQPAPVAAPPPGQVRDAVMDANPFTYSVMAAEVPRWYADVDTDPTSPQPGQAAQYAIVDVDSVSDSAASNSGSKAPTGVGSVAVALRLSGSAKWYSSDLGWEYPLTTSGRARTVVKLPLGWSTHAVTGVRVEVAPSGAAPDLVVKWLKVQRFDPVAIAVDTVPTPPPTVVPETLGTEAVVPRTSGSARA